MSEVDDRDLAILFLINKVPESSCYEFRASIPWSSRAIATPLIDFRDAQMFCKKSLGFMPDRSAWAYMNQETLRNLLGNTNTVDLYGRRTQGVFTGVIGINELLYGDDLPSVKVISTMKDGIVTIVCPQGFIIMHVI